MKHLGITVAIVREINPKNVTYDQHIIKEAHPHKQAATFQIEKV